jgi:exodeoxyribonuclease VII small subunit
LLHDGADMARKKSTDFETSIKELEKLVERMEEGELGLDESLQAFERGIALSRSCQKALEDAEQKVRMVVEKNGKEELETFEHETDAGDQT